MNPTAEKQTPMTTPDGLIMHEQIGVGLVVSAAEHCFMLSKWESERAALEFRYRNSDIGRKTNNTPEKQTDTCGSLALGDAFPKMPLDAALQFADEKSTTGGIMTCAALESLAAEVRRLQGVIASATVRCNSYLASSDECLAAGTFTLCRFLADQRPMTPEERAATDEFFLSLFEPNAPAGAQPPH